MSLTWQSAGSISAFVVAYFLGAIPFALIYGEKYLSVDVRDFGSGNLGSTNFNRIVKRMLSDDPKRAVRLSLVVLLSDMAKGTVAVLLARYVLATTAPLYMRLLWMMTAIAGHMFPIYLYPRVKGGKGVAVAAGCLLVLLPKVFCFLLVAFLIVYFRTGHKVSAGSVFIAVLFPGLVWFGFGDRRAIIVASVMSAAVLLGHLQNIFRLLQHQEKGI